MLSDTIIEPSTVMIEAIDTSIALTTMLRRVLHMRLTDFTEVLVVRVVKRLTIMIIEEVNTLCCQLLSACRWWDRWDHFL